MPVYSEESPTDSKRLTPKEVCMALQQADNFTQQGSIHLQNKEKRFK